MNIAFISYWSCPVTRLGVLRAGGMNVYLLNLSRELANLGQRIDIYTRTHQEKDIRIIPLNKSVRLIHLPQSYKDHYKAAEKFAVKIGDFIRKERLEYDILHAHYYYSGLTGLILKRSLDLPLIQTFHTLGVMKKIYAGINDGARITAEKKITAGTDTIIASTLLEKETLEKHYAAVPSKIHVVSPGVDHHLFTPYDKKAARKTLGLPRDKKIILFVGRIDPVKGLSLLIEAIFRLTQKYSFFQDRYRVLLIGGDIESRAFWRHPEVRRIKKLIIEKKIDCCIKFLGSKPYKVLPKYYAAADVVVMPSVYESFGLVVIEAMACGAAILASRVGGIKYLINHGKNGWLFESGNSQDLSQKLWDLLENKKERQKLAGNAIISSKAYCWDKQAAKIARIYEGLIKVS